MKNTGSQLLMSLIFVCHFLLLTTIDTFHLKFHHLYCNSPLHDVPINIFNHQQDPPHQRTMVKSSITVSHQTRTNILKPSQLIPILTKVVRRTRHLKFILGRLVRVPPKNVQSEQTRDGNSKYAVIFSPFFSLQYSRDTCFR